MAHAYHQFDLLSLALDLLIVSYYGLFSLASNYQANRLNRDPSCRRWRPMIIRNPEVKRKISHTYGLGYATTRMAEAALFAVLVMGCPAG